ncbi:MAG: hypothetical protein CUN49_11000 [Candidatus Thermofonsia Clade 1 bacterium]|jgi:hypothetical protein|uniref:C-type cytochrome biogenesis protein CcmI n=1 Tax=Candidatus Thermofonsia Clade 1 bacterium TaxID=2364210 RepID=A0A2M8PCT6_9CHLR|nr:MAG: hypothetical protein CUN49_11000 [Candidatus Thermofonsia Clade 1 bacterium]RMF51809.1 MAG: hypothetical protein D6749_06780 [Chloroflexota bacterium]
MSLEALALSLALIVALLLWIAAPLLRHGSRFAEHADVVLTERLQQHYERVLSALRDLEEDYSLGKLSQARYQAEREHWIAQGVEVLAELDRIGAFETADRTAAELDAAVDRQIEQAVAAYRKAHKLA